MMVNMRQYPVTRIAACNTSSPTDDSPCSLGQETAG
jgi:hypothetical protein